MKSYTKHKLGFIIAMIFFVILVADTWQMNNPIRFVEMGIIGLIGCCIGFGIMLYYGINTVSEDIAEVRTAFYEYKHKPNMVGFPKEIV